MQIAADDFCRPPHFAPGALREIEEVRVEPGTIHLKSGESRLVASADFHAIVEGLVRLIREPEAKPLLRQLLMPEIAREAENPGEETTAHLRSRFPDLTIEFDRFLDNQDARVGPASFDQKGRGCARKGAAQDRDIELGTHGVG